MRTHPVRHRTQYSRFYNVWYWVFGVWALEACVWIAILAVWLVALLVLLAHERFRRGN